MQDFYDGQEVIVTIGIPGCGKSKWAKDFSYSVRKTKYFALLERDIIRATMSEDGDINNYKYTRQREKDVTTAYKARLHRVLDCGSSLIISDTNLNEQHRLDLFKYLALHYPQVRVTMKVFDTSLKTCIKRNQKRHATVPESVLLRMEKQMRELLGKIRYGYSQGRPHCIIVDIDGTVADMKGVRGPFEWSRVGEDKPIWEVINLINGYLANPVLNTQVVFLSGRDGVCKPETKKWLDLYFKDYELYMRPEGSTESDDIVKERLYTNHIHLKYNVDFVMDDRKQVCQLWESMGLKLINVGGTCSDF